MSTRTNPRSRTASRGNTASRSNANANSNASKPSAGRARGGAILSPAARRNGRPSAANASRSATRIGLAEGPRRAVATLLTHLLADQHVLAQKTRMCHWNLVSGRFDPLHKLFETQYEALAAAIDETAERIRMVGQVSPAALAEMIEHARLEEARGELVTGQRALAMLLEDHETSIRQLRDDIATCEDDLDDVGTADYLTGLLRQHEKTAWMLRSHLEA